MSCNKRLDISNISFDDFLNMQGTVFRHIKNRITKRIFIGNNSVIIKLHNKMGAIEYISTLAKFKLPVIGAKPEKQGIELLENINVSVPKILGFHQEGILFNQKSYIIIEDLGDCATLEDWVNDNKTQKKDSKSVQYKQKMITEVAKIARKIHSANLVHRDFYLCHFLIQSKLKKDNLVLIDLHRCQKASEKLIIKDLAALLFSAENTLTKSDKHRFIKEYSRNNSYNFNNKDFWQQVEIRAQVLFNRNKRG